MRGVCKFKKKEKIGYEKEKFIFENIVSDGHNDVWSNFLRFFSK